MVQEDTENINLFGVKDCKKTADELKFKWNLRTKIKENHVEAYNWVVSICLKYVSLPWIMVNSFREVLQSLEPEGNSIKTLIL